MAWPLRRRNSFHWVNETMAAIHTIRRVSQLCERLAVSPRLTCFAMTLLGLLFASVNCVCPLVECIKMFQMYDMGTGTCGLARSPRDQPMCIAIVFCDCKDDWSDASLLKGWQPTHALLQLAIGESWGLSDLSFGYIKIDADFLACCVKRCKWVILKMSKHLILVVIRWTFQTECVYFWRFLHALLTEIKSYNCQVCREMGHILVDAKVQYQSPTCMCDEVDATCSALHGLCHCSKSWSEWVCFVWCCSKTIQSLTYLCLWVVTRH